MPSNPLTDLNVLSNRPTRTFHCKLDSGVRPSAIISGWFPRETLQLFHSLRNIGRPSSRKMLKGLELSNEPPCTVMSQCPLVLTAFCTKLRSVLGQSALAVHPDRLSKKPCSMQAFGSDLLPLKRKWSLRDVTSSAPEQTETSVLVVPPHPRPRSTTSPNSNAEHVGFIRRDTRRSEDQRSHTCIVTRFLSCSQRDRR